jgi:hypothetical protein
MSSPFCYPLRVSTRLQHSLRFAVTTLVAVYAIGLLWEVVDTFVLHPVGSRQAEDLVTFNEQVWRSIAAAEAAAVFLLRLGDMRTDRPTWRLAWGLGAWLGVTSVGALIAIEEQYWWTAGIIIVIAIALGFALHHWPRIKDRLLAAGVRERELH